MKRAVLLVLFAAIPLFASDSLFFGTWVERLPAGSKRPQLTMTVSDAGGGKRLITYTTAGQPQKMTVLTRGEGEDAPVLLDGKPTGQTMAIRVVDERHRATVLKMNGKQTGTSRAELSAEGKVLTVENATESGQKTVAYWDRQ
jgi:hypothetical protein